MVMRLCSMIPRLTPPKIIKTETLPTFGHVCRAASDPQARQGEEEPILYNDMVAANTEMMTLSSLFSPSFPPSPTTRAIFLGEQHHQPKALAAQLQVIHQLFQNVKEPSKVNVVFEQWSLYDQPYLNSNFNKRSQGENVGEDNTFHTRVGSEDKTNEGFNANHYLTIAQVVHELGGTVWGGFPPRSWAQVINKAEGNEAFGQVQKLDNERFEADDKNSKEENIVPPLSIADYSHVERVSWAYRTHLKSMFRPDERPLIPIEAENAPETPPSEVKGFLAAQAIKDTFLAHTMSSILAKDSANVVLAVVGLGHCEWGFGAPERLKSMSGTDPIIIITKPNDSGYWPALQGSEDQRKATAKPSSDWNRKQADFILLYDWVD